MSEQKSVVIICNSTGSLTELQKQINDAILNGYRIHGTMIIDREPVGDGHVHPGLYVGWNTHYIQFMIRDAQ